MSQKPTGMRDVGDMLIIAGDGVHIGCFNEGEFPGFPGLQASSD